MPIFHDFDFSDFWVGSQYERETCVGSSLNADLVASIEEELGYKLPQSYVELARFQNGGIPKNTCHATATPTYWAANYSAIAEILPIDRKPDFALCGKSGSKYMMGEWGYPPIGVLFGHCPSGGHNMLCLDYRDAGPGKEPTVVDVEAEPFVAITFVAKDFETYIRGLKHKDNFPIEDD